MPDIIVVDDSPTQASQIAAILRQRDAVVRTASNGKEALAALEEKTPDLVVTDMQMPEMNGVELIRQMRSKFPLVPAILVTAFGSEGLAAEALGVGAANYISKEHVDVLLPDMAKRISNFGHANSESLLLKGALTRRPLEFMLDCTIERVAPLVSLLIRVMASMNVLHTGDRIRIAESIHYLLFHTILHENLEEPVAATPIGFEDAVMLVESKRAAETGKDFADRSVCLQLEVGERQARFFITHEGAGQSIHQAPMPGTPQSFADERGRGMLLLTSVMDEVFIDPAHGGVTLIKYI